MTGTGGLTRRPPCRSSSAARRRFRRSPSRPTERPSSPVRRSRSRGRPPIPTRSARRVGIEMDGAAPPQHARPHVRGGLGLQGSFVAEDHGPIGTFSYEIILEATDSSGLKATTSVTLPVGADTTPPSAPTGLTATTPSWDRAQLTWGASTDNGAVSGYRVERCQGVGCTSFSQVSQPATRAISTRTSLPRRTTAIGLRRSTRPGT